MEGGALKKLPNLATSLLLPLQTPNSNAADAFHLLLSPTPHLVKKVVLVGTYCKFPFFLPSSRKEG